MSPEQPRVSAFTEGSLDVGGARVRFLEAGSGPAVVAVEAEPGRAHQALAQRFRVVALEPAGGGGRTVHEVARALGDAIAALGIDRCGLVATGADAAAALHLAADAPELIDRLILVSPLVPGREDDPAALATPVLVLVGAEDRTATADAGRRWEEALPGSSYVLVHDAGPDVAGDRPAAFASVVGDFLEWGPQFVVSHVSQAIHP